MVCPKCHFALLPFDADCPRCRNFAALGIDLPVPTHTAESILSNTSPLDNRSKAEPQDTAGNQWYSQLDLEDERLENEGLEDKEAVANRRFVVTKTVTMPPSARKPVRPIPRQAISPSPIFKPRVPRASMACQENMQDVSTIQFHPAETSSFVQIPPFLFASVALLAALGLVILLSSPIFRTGTTARNPSITTNPMLLRASDLISQANATRTQFQQSELTPEIAANSLHLRTLQYQEALRMCQASQASGQAQSSLLIQQQAASGLKQVESDSWAQVARVLTAEVTKDIARYKGASLTDEKAASIRTSLRAKCQAALVDCAQSLDADPVNSVALVERVHAFRHLGDEQSANSALAHAILLCPGNPILLPEKGIKP